MSQPLGAMGAMGGPVGGGQQMNVGTPTNSNVTMSTETHIKRLNTAIYDYLLRLQLYDMARDFMNKVPIETKGDIKRSPNQRNGQQQPNGNEDGMDVEVKDPALLNRPDDLPLPAEYLGDGPFLQDWWVQFWELWNGQRRNAVRPSTLDYIAQQRATQKARMGAVNNMNPNAMQNMRGYMGMNGMQPDIRRAIANQRMTPQQVAQLKNMNAQQAQAMAGNPMERQGSTMENSSGSPNPGGEDPPSKRQRLDGSMAQMNQARPGPPGQMPGTQAAVEGYAAAMQQQMAAALNKASSDITKGMPPGAMGPNGTQGSPPMMDNATKEQMFVAGANGRMPMQNNGGVAGQTAQGGNHALQDYQMQLMLLEQQNKKRLLMARQEQDMGHTGIGPNGSPMAAMMDPNMRQQMIPQMGPNGQIRPPSSHPMAQMSAQQAEMIRQQQGAQMMQNGAFPGQHQSMMPGQQPPPGAQPGQGQPMGTPRQQNSAMPPPPAPQNNPGGTQPSSPSSQPAPPTPNQAGKAKGKKNESKNAKKKGAAANPTPASEAEHPPTPTPPTPMTPHNAQNFNQNKQLPNGQSAPGGQPNAQGNNQAQANNAVPQQPMPNDLSNAPFGDLNTDGFGGMDIPFSAMDNPDVLDSFDFDSFLNDSSDNPLGFDANFAFGDGGIETGGLEGAN